MSESTINVREEAQRFINALHALCPSRNYLSQYLLMIPKEYPTIYDLFPEFLSEVEIRENLKTALGLSYGYQTDVVSDRLAYHYRNFLLKLFDLMEDSSVRTSLCSLLGITDEALFNPRLEWIKSKLAGIKSESRDGPDIIKILQVLLTTDEPYAHWRKTQDLKTKLNKTDEEVQRILKLAEDLLLVQREQKGDKAGYTLAAELKKYIRTIEEIIKS